VIRIAAGPAADGGGSAPAIGARTSDARRAGRRGSGRGQARRGEESAGDRGEDRRGAIRKVIDAERTAAAPIGSGRRQEAADGDGRSNGPFDRTMLTLKLDLTC
jgi:hypothetical protein